jgi:hypothetical protein
MCFSAVLENICEPFYVTLLNKMEMGFRVKAEGLAIFLKSMLIYVLLSFDMKLLAFAGA